MLGHMLSQCWQRRFKSIMANLLTIAFIICSGIGVMGFGLAPAAWADAPPGLWSVELSTNPSTPLAMGPFTVLATSPSTSMPESDGVTLFETQCAGCHPKGGNIIKRGKTLKLKPLTRRHLDSVEAIATFVTQGKGLMSAYGEILTPEEISTVSAYVWEQAQTNWKP